MWPQELLGDVNIGQIKRLNKMTDAFVKAVAVISKLKKNKGLKMDFRLKVDSEEPLSWVWCMC